MIRKIVVGVILPIFLFAGLNELKTLSISTKDNYVEIKLGYTSPPSNIHDFVLKDPPRIVIDAEGTKYALGSLMFPVNQGVVLRIRGSQFKKEPMMARIVVDLKKQVKYEVIREGSSVRVRVYTSPTKVGYKKTVKGNNKSKNLKTHSLKSKSSISAGTRVFYNSRGRRDPFKPIKESSFQGDTLLDIAKAKLIGIVQDSTGYVALVEDKNGKGFILRRGDKIKRGRVIRITKDMAVFAISDFGFTRTVILKLEKEEEVSK